MIDSYEYNGPIGKEVDLDEVRKIQIGILDALVKACEKYGLRYYLSGGTLLGAVRHKGYIPWDDDMDINMPRTDCDKLLELTGGKLDDRYELGSFDGPIPHTSTFLRAYDTEYLLRQEASHGQVRAYTSVSIDVFPIEGLPRAKWLSNIHYAIAKCLINLRLVAFLRVPAGYRGWHRLIRSLIRIPAKLVGWRNWAKLVTRHARRYNYDKSDYVGVATCHVHTFSERVPRECYGEAVKVEFEGKMYNAPHDWNRYLSQLYGDYMKLPPAEKQVRRHHYTVFRLKEDEK